MNNLDLNKKQGIELAEIDRLRNIFVTGLPGSGVSNYVINLILQDISSSKTSIIIDPYGDLADKIIQSTPSEHLSNIIYIDVWNQEYPVGLNIFQAKDDYEKREVANTLINLMYNLYDPQKTGIIGPRFDHAVRNAILTIFFDEKPTFVELLRCLTDKTYVERILPKITDSVVKNYWTKQIPQTSDFHKSEVLDYIVSKFSPFITDKRVRNIVCQTDSKFDLENLIKTGKTIIFDFGKYYYDKEANKILSSLLFHIISKKLRIREDKKNSNISLYVNEVQKWDSQSLIEIIMDSARNNVSVTSISSRLKQIDKSLRYELFRSGTIISFRQIGKDAEKLTKDVGFGEIETFLNLKKYHAIIKTLNNGDVIPLKEIDTFEKIITDKNRNVGEIKTNSQQQMGKAKEQVEKEIEKRME